MRTRKIVEAESAKDFLKRKNAGAKPYAFQVSSNWGDLFVGNDGYVVRIRLNPMKPEDGDAHPLTGIAHFNVHEWKKRYPDESLSKVRNIDILDIGFWLDNGEYEPPDATWRDRFGRLRHLRGPEHARRVLQNLERMQARKP